ncbi:DUF1376 domain-containing protein [Chryseobacterium carnipullorum]|uniref:DUF1376 domain-containing protein n=1 Tax=Chryseobacterium carnipullorum TaxID=1124835 RepID=A0A376DU20_CHRCU|nr:HNH endonuclease [Chryseobacterium carnipullorum]AZA49774.1 DUF1376 domain-containing protein [Chryseobacterium carnipullorum]AZA64666.1 DUF1376 domain-containing protein [Chryseobacterium carnipullorum]STC95680.1 HNH endonuclease [Chryseobacterium carnipullorum]
MKDPAFLFYSKDFYEGTRMMLPKERACYMDLLVYQHQNGKIPDDNIILLDFCHGVDEATLKTTLNLKFSPSDNGWVCRDNFIRAFNHLGGENHWNWLGGVSDAETKFRTSAPYVRWKKKVLRRDKYKCANCFSTENLHVHHIKPYALFKDLRTVISNGVTLCQPCHVIAHKNLIK